MKKNFIAFFLLVIVSAFGQSQLSVVRSADRAPIKGASILCNGKILGRTNDQGKFSFKTKCRLVSVQASGYYEDEVVVDKVIEAALSPISSKTQSIQGIVIEDKSDPRALEILQEVRRRYDDNAPKSLESYSFKSYEKISLDLDQDSIAAYNKFLDRRLDSLRILPATAVNSNLKKDSAERENILKLMAQSKLFLWERASEFLYSEKYGEKINILDSRVSGLQEPIYELLALRSNRNRMPREIRQENTVLYRYFLTDSIDIEGRTTFVIRFRQVDYKKPLQRRKYNGYMYIDAESYALRKIESNSKVKSEGSITSIWKPIEGKWFLSKENMKIRMGNARFLVGKPGKENENSMGPKFGNYVYLLADYFDFKTNSNLQKKEFSGYNLTVKNANGSLLNQFRTDSLTPREEMTYLKIDSVGKKYKLDQKLEVFSGFLKGYIRVGIVDFDALKAFQYNQYEGVRVGIGIKLNEKFHRYISPDAYVAYGFKDHIWKYSAGVDVKTTVDKVSFFRAEFYDDVEAAGRFNENLWNSKMRIMNGGIDLNNDRFYAYRGAKLSYENDLTNALTLNISAQRDHEEAKFNYNFNNLGSAFENFATHITLKYSPASKNMMTPSGKVTYKQEYPEFYFNYEQGLRALGGDLSYSRFDFLAQHQFSTGAGVSSARLFSGLLAGDAPIWHHFVVNGLGSGRSGLNLNFTSYLGFATMEGGKYFADKFIGGYAAHRIPFYFRTFGKTTSSFNLVYKAIIGDMTNKSRHHFDFETLDNLYEEVGFEVNSILGSPFDLGFFYRVGHYATPAFKENFAIQLKLSLLGF